ncbi:MAG TPA: hypothetical protein VFG68_17430 [Fimbriiglobus sp.]|nr:hypothetical protein [Fimbriiglobus sp.]
MTITFPDDMREMLEREAHEAGMLSVDVYVLTMYSRAKHIPENEDLDPATRQRLLTLAETGLKSPPISDPRGFLAELVRDTNPVTDE